MLTLRVHLDDMPDDDAPLLIAPARTGWAGSPGGGRRSPPPSHAAARSVRAGAGDIWCYTTAILHTSAAAHGHRRRRVSQVDYAADALPAGLKWPGI